MTESPRRRKLWAALIVAAAAPTAAPAADFTLRDWYAACDNLRTCTAIGFSPEGAERRAMLILTRAGEAAARPGLVVVVEGDGAGTLELALDRVSVSRVQARREGESGLLEAAVPNADADALLARLTNGSVLRITGPKGLEAEVSLSGSAGALRWVDDQQKRTGGQTALVARGPAAAAAIPAPPPLPVVRARPAQPQTGLPRSPPAGLRAAVAECREEGAGRRDVVPHRLEPDVLLWMIACGDGAYNFIDRLLLTDAAGRNPRSPFADPKVEAGLMNVDYDPATRTLSDFGKARGLGDCGGASEWVWTGVVFTQTEESRMDLCRGALPAHWPVTYRARVER